MDVPVTTPDPDYATTGRGRTEAERLAFLARLEREQAEEDARGEHLVEAGRAAIATFAVAAVCLAAAAGLVGGVVVVLVVLGPLPALLAAIFVVLCVIAARLNR